MTKRQVRKRKPDSTDDIDRAVHLLRAYHTLGLKLLKDYPAKTHDTDTARQEAAQNGFGENYMKIFQIRAFADPKKGYRKEELDDLVKLCWEHHYALGFSFIPRFMAVPKAKRAAFQKKAIAGGWSSAMVDRERFANYPGRPDVGRKPQIPNKLKPFLVDLMSLALYLRNVEQELQEPHDTDNPQLRWHDLPDDVQKPLRSVVSAMKKLEHALGVYLPKTEKGSPSGRA